MDAFAVVVPVGSKQAVGALRVKVAVLRTRVEQFLQLFALLVGTGALVTRTRGVVLPPILVSLNPMALGLFALQVVEEL